MPLQLAAGTNETISEPSSARDYQAEAVDTIWKALHEQDLPVCLVLPTGAGKTRVANDLIIRWMEQYDI